MKRVLVLIFGVMVAAAAYAQTAATAKVSGPVISWDKATHDFGAINQGDVVEHTFKFTNTGTEPLIITNVQVTCGCTTPKGWPRDPVAVGGKGEIVIAFNSSGKQGKQDKVVTVISNATNAEGGSVRFTTDVLAKPVPSPQ